MEHIWTKWKISKDSNWLNETNMLLKQCVHSVFLHLAFHSESIKIYISDDLPYIIPENLPSGLSLYEC